MSIQEHRETVKYLCQFQMNEERVAAVLDILRATPELLGESWCGPLLSSGNATMRAALDRWRDELGVMDANALAAQDQRCPDWLMVVARLSQTPTETLATILNAQTSNGPIHNMALCRRVVGNLYRSDPRRRMIPELKESLHRLKKDEVDPIALRAIEDLLES
jgi:hypothetical protein